MSCKGRRVPPVRRRSDCGRPRGQAARLGTRTAGDRCKQECEGVNLIDSGGLADLPGKPLRKWQATYWTLAIFLSLIASTIASSKEENWFPVNNPQTREIPAQDKKVSISRTSMESQEPVESQGSLESKTDERGELPTQSVWPTVHYQTAILNRLGEFAEDVRSRYERSPGSSHKGKERSKTSRRNRRRGSRKMKKNKSECHINTLKLKVEDLGLGYKSEEIVDFKYCSGNCPRYESNYDLTLSKMLNKNGILSNTDEIVINHPCCRPSKYTDIAFLDLQNQWQIITNVSAVECMCQG
ncbi:glial cell line-derived neurotrophic factor-like [Hemiscyllium ocellatum]|uniref:glial cell line-derived neurotrophic factor-like n=1 Tax=Hemiscyllium ocellatum TaxID=170820 RepID=UPI0029670650|nr:glial cell line-derived neurotrophic factor-like [Hemiscyllium ocellatum]